MTASKYLLQQNQSRGQLLHGLFSLKPAGTVMCIQPPDRFNKVYKDSTDVLGMRYSFAMGEGVTETF